MQTSHYSFLIHEPCWITSLAGLGSEKTFFDSSAAWSMFSHLCSTGSLFGIFMSHVQLNSDLYNDVLIKF